MKHSNNIATDALLEHWLKEGKLVEGGWEAYAARNLKDAPPEQIQAMRTAWMLGAQHVYAALLHLSDSEQKAKYINAMTEELKEFQRFHLGAIEVKGDEGK